jgi:outer membrane lipopolysaccharide assembly protein LptE/RlpB
MSKIKLLILLFSIFLNTSCSIKLQNVTDYNNKFSVNHLSGGQDAFIFRNIFIQQLIANNIYDANSELIIALSISNEEEYLSTSITKVATRKLNRLIIDTEVFTVENKDCILFQENYSSEQSYLLSNSSANLSNIAAESDIFLINSENISLKIIDALLIKQDNFCEINE